MTPKLVFIEPVIHLLHKALRSNSCTLCVEETKIQQCTKELEVVKLDSKHIDKDARCRYVPESRVRGLESGGAGGFVSNGHRKPDGGT